MKLISELESTSTNTLVHDHKLQKKKKTFSSFEPITQHYQKHACSFLSKQSKKIHEGQPSKAFYKLYPKKTFATRGVSL